MEEQLWTSFKTQN